MVLSGERGEAESNRAWSAIDAARSAVLSTKEERSIENRRQLETNIRRRYVPMTQEQQKHWIHGEQTLKNQDHAVGITAATAAHADGLNADQNIHAMEDAISNAIRV